MCLFLQHSSVEKREYPLLIIDLHQNLVIASSIGLLNKLSLPLLEGLELCNISGIPALQNVF